ncbi:glycosyltransferase family 4 protein [Psychrosphaera aquimarina]|uniref:Glycosyltransferase family 4 protein n=1 Tax=Psychrosphaera aquimarina TaxID=2044854 RepID=A0ABU3R4J8_9GAMM|nr:glycosyltransferase family 4 protein [Psychrosphaera aquimarina]MDU0114573.1 glycosyltransferase family 4 protein [Psychrosphaera aquimarina]
MNGGVRSYEFSRRLAVDGHSVSVITADTENTFQGWKIEKFENIEIHWISIKYDNSFGYVKRLYAFFKFLTLSSIYILKRPSDILIATSTPLSVAIPALLYHWFKRKPYIFEVRDVWPEVPIALKVIKNRIIIFLAEQLEKLVYKNAKSIIALSPDMKHSIESRCEAPVIRVIPNAADTELFNVKPSYMQSDVYKRLSQLKVKHEKVVFYTGTLGLVNNLRYLIHLSSFSDGGVAFVIIGSGKEEVDLKAYASELGVLSSKLYFYPSVSKSELFIIHKLFDLACSTVLPIKALYANSANKIFDAFASGTPIMINHEGWLQNLILKYECGVVLQPEPSLNEYKKLHKFLFSSIQMDKAKLASTQLGMKKFNRDVLYKEFKQAVEE